MNTNLEILKCLHELELQDAGEATRHAFVLMAEVNRICSSMNVVDLNSINQATQQLHTSLENYTSAFKHLSQSLHNVLEKQFPEFEKMNQQIWETKIEKMLYPEHREWTKQWPPTVENRDYFIKRIEGIINWQFPSLMVGVKDTDLLQYMLGCDPIYVVEHFAEYHDVQNAMYNEVFARRKRAYMDTELHLLPPNGLQLIVVWNEFPFIPLTQIADMIKKLAASIMPGGYLLFNYNDALTVQGFKYFNEELMSFTTTKQILDICEKNGLSINYHFSAKNENFHFLEVKKHGYTEPIKRSTSIGIISTISQMNDSL